MNLAFRCENVLLGSLFHSDLYSLYVLDIIICKVTVSKESTIFASKCVNMDLIIMAYLLQVGGQAVVEVLHGHLLVVDHRSLSPERGH